VRLAQGQIRAVSWQVVPTALTEPKKAKRVTKAFMQMKKFDIAAERAL